MNLIEFKRLFGKRLRQTRNDRDLSQEALAEAADINPRYLSRIELGQAIPSIYVSWCLAQALQVPLTELTEEDPTDVVARIQQLLGHRSPAEQKRALRVLTELLS